MSKLKSGAPSSAPLGNATSSLSSSPTGSGSGTPPNGITGQGTSTTKANRAARHIGAVVDDWPMYSSMPDDYIMGDVIGFGASSVVYQAAFQPLSGKACAVKVIDLEAFGRDTEELRRETQLMSLSKHPNVLRVRGCWVRGSKLHIATRLMSAGSLLDIMRFSHPDGFEEVVIATALKQALEGLRYMHVNGWLHRDLKAANMLVDDDGTVLLGDFGVGVFLGDGDDGPSEGKDKDENGNQKIGQKKDGSAFADGKRKSFVGTPCWMAPEVVERKHYGTSADIWSFGITCLELSQGRAPHSRFPPVKVLMKTLQDEPPTLDRTGGAHKYSKVMEDFVRVCLQKDPEKRPSAEKLLQHAFFKQAKPKKHLITAVLAGLPPLSERQEKRRKMSIVSLKNQASWDFGSVSSISGLSSMAEKMDPFSNFTGVISGPTSPAGSMRERFGSTRSRIISIDGHHAIVAEENDTHADRLASSFRSPLKKLESEGEMEGESEGRFGSLGAAGSRRARNRSSDSNPNFNQGQGSLGRRAIGHRKSVSFDFNSDERPLDSNGNVIHSDGLNVNDGALEPITEKKSPMVLPEDANEVPPLQLDEKNGAGTDVSPDATPKLPSSTPEKERKEIKHSTVVDEKLEASPRLLPQLADMVSSKVGSGTKRDSVLGKLFKGKK